MKSKAAAAPYLVWMAIFIIVPMFLVIFFAFTDKSGSFSLENIMQAGQYSNVFLRSIWAQLRRLFACSLVTPWPILLRIARRGGRM